jgi:hypothetical protein
MNPMTAWRVRPPLTAGAAGNASRDRGDPAIWSRTAPGRKQSVNMDGAEGTALTFDPDLGFSMSASASV